MAASSLYPAKTDWRSIHVANVVSFIMMLQISCILPTIWPYIKRIYPSITESTYGYLGSVGALVNMVSAAGAGLVSDYLADTGPALVTGKIFGVIGSLVYLTIERFYDYTFALFMTYQVLNALSTGLTSVFRTHISMNSSEKDRSKAFALSMLIGTIGFQVGPFVQLAFTTLGYPGYEMFFGIHFNMYTAAVVVTLIILVPAIVALIIFYDGKMHGHAKGKKVITEGVRLSFIGSTKIFQREPEEAKEEKINYDRVAMVIVIVLRVVYELNLQYLVVVSNIFLMASFSWSSEETIRYSAILMGCLGCIALFIPVGYMFFKLGDRLPEKKSLLISLILFLSFFIVAYPWSFLSETMAYEHVVGQPEYFNQTEARIALESTRNETTEVVGCNINYAWCADTPRVSPWVYCVAFVLLFGTSLPLLTISLDLMYSKVLGPIKQGFEQSLFMISGQVCAVLGPLVFTQIYTSYGPRPIFQFEIAIISMGIILTLVFYKRLIPYTELVEKKTKKIITD